MSATAYPLCWPPAFPRCAPAKREKGAFKATLPAALKNVDVKDSNRLLAGQPTGTAT